MKVLSALLKSFVFIMLVTIAHVAVSRMVQSPSLSIHASIAAIILYIFYNESGASMWHSFFIFFMLEQFSAEPFGILLISGVFATLCCLWLYRYTFTNRSWYSLAGLTCITVLFMRVVSILLLYVFHLSTQDILPSFIDLVAQATREIAGTTLFTVCVYGVVTGISSKRVTQKTIFRV